VVISGKTLHEDVINAQTYTAIPETFFSIRDSIYYIKERGTLISIKIQLK
jgi:hypothetical protein